MPEWSKQQLEAIHTVDRSLLVSAAAGSGKTATLTERCVDLTCKAQVCDITNMLVVTYTEAAAAEMKGRIAKELRELESGLANKGEDVSRVRRQLALLPSAQISTLHGFCSRLIRRNFQLLSLDPDFTVLDENEATLLKQEVISELFEQQFQRPGAERFTGLIDLYADGSDNRIETAVIRTHDVLRSLLNGAAWRQEAMALLSEVESKPSFMESAIGKRFAAMVAARVDDLRQHAGRVRDALGRIGGTGSHIGVVDEVIERLDRARRRVEEGQWSDAAAILDEDFSARMQAKGCADPELAKGLVEKLKRAVKSGDISRCLACDMAAWRENIIRTIPFAGMFLELVEMFGQRFETAKRAANGLDFADLEHLALRLLGEPSVAADCRERFVQVMVDEFQDVNEVQWTILQRLSRVDGKGRPANLFCVGDVKQSIYRFRMADPSIFLAREKEAWPLKQLIPMQHNFRSRGELLETVNFVFGELMQSEAAAEIAYTNLHRLQARRGFPPQDGAALCGAPVEMHLIIEGGMGAETEEDSDTTPVSEEVDLDRMQRESRYVAGWIEKLMKEGRQVLTKAGTYRPLDYGDIVILLRSARFSAIEYSRALSERSIPCFAESRTGFFTAVETNDLISILRLLDNQQQDIPMAAVLRCPIFGIPKVEESLAAIRLAFPGMPFHQAVVAYARRGDALAQSLKALLERLDRWRHQALMLPVSDLLWRILDDTSYLAFCNALPNGRQRVANVLYLHRCARKFSKFQQQGLYRFIQLLEELQEASDLGQPSPGEAGNAVQVMTIHGSKGLEFPVVILSEIGKRFNLQDAAGNILVDRKNHLALQVADADRFVRYPSAASLLVRESIVAASKAEELRILYVAMTRAQEKLLLVGSTTQKQLDVLRKQSSPGLDPQVFRAANSYLEWMVPLASMDVAEARLKIEPIDAASITRPKLAGALDEPPAKAQATEAPDVLKAITFSYPHAIAAATRAANSVTGLSKGNEIPVVAEFDPPPEAADASELAVARGLAVHRFMEHLDLSIPLEGQAQRMVAAGQLSDEDAKLIDLDDVRWFVNESPVGQMMRKHHAGVVRELPMLDSVVAEGLTSPDPYDRVMLRGRLDAVAQTPEGLWVIDYKTDKKYPEPNSERERAYRKQMEFYRQTLDRSGFGKVLGVHLVFLRCRRILSM